MGAASRRILEKFGINRNRTTVHKWIHQADLEPTAVDIRNPDQVALAETVVKRNDERFWLYAAVGPEPNAILHVRVFPPRPIMVPTPFLRAMADNYNVGDADFLVDGKLNLKRRLPDRHVL